MLSQKRRRTPWGKEGVTDCPDSLKSGCKRCRLTCISYTLALLLLHFSMLFGEDASDLMNDLMIVDKVNQCARETLPVYYNNFLYGGYINMPSARMGCVGEIGFGYSDVYPYKNINLRFQFLDRLEISGNYRIFTGIDDPILSCSGFGDKSDKGANIKLALLHPEETGYVLPGIAIGLDDFIGTKGFESRYIVFTQVFPKWNLECSVGYGGKRIDKWFGGVTWYPFYQSRYTLLQSLALVAEWDAFKYKSKIYEPHPDARSKKSSLNYGLKYRLFNFIDLTLSYTKGEKLSFAFSTFYNFGNTFGFFPKIGDPLPYKSPKNLEPLGPLRDKDTLVQDLFYPFLDQGFFVQDVWLSCTRYQKILRIRVGNFTWRYEDEVKLRFQKLLANIIPSDISEVVIVLENGELPTQEWRYHMDFVRLYGENALCPYEMDVLSPMQEAKKANCKYYERLFKSPRSVWNIEWFPKTYTAFGSARGKFKYLVGVHCCIDGFIYDWYYNILLGYTLSTTLDDVNDVDRLNPSQIINVRTDIVNYYKASRFTVDRAYLQKCCNLGHGWYGSLSFGLFEIEYGGAALELLYYPVNSRWAFGIEGAVLGKRQFSGIGFTDRARKLKRWKKTYVKFHPYQCFASLYYNIEDWDMDIRFKVGKFLANDVGIRTEISRYYPSGMRFYCWYTYTNAKDYVNGRRYHDTGVGISLPLDMFYTYSCREWWGYAMSSWLRDVGQYSATGFPLYYKIRDNRERLLRPMNY